MADTVTYADVESRILFRADANSSAPGFTSPAERSFTINTYYKQLYNLLADAQGDEFYNVDTSFPTVSGTMNYDLDSVVAAAGTKFFKLLSAHIKDGTRVRRLYHWERAELDRILQMEAAGVSQYGLIKYRLAGANMQLRPKPRAVYTILISYVPTAPKLVTSGPAAGESTTLDGVSGFEEWVVLSGAIIIKEKKNADVSVLVQEREKLERQIEQIRADRNALDAPAVQSRGHVYSLNAPDYPPGLYDQFYYPGG